MGEGNTMKTWRVVLGSREYQEDPETILITAEDCYIQNGTLIFENQDTIIVAMPRGEWYGVVLKGESVDG